MEMEMEMGTGAPTLWPAPSDGGDASFSSSCVAFVMMVVEGEVSF